MKRKIKKYNARHEEKIREREEKEKSEKEKSDSEIRPFSLQSALGIIVSSFIGTTIIPFLLTFVGIKDMRMGIVLGNTFFTSFAFTWVRHFIDSKKGFSKSFWIQYAIFGVIFAIISYLWFFWRKFV
ncbi:MAG: hypothetical protein Q4D53_04600 [Leptotrichiaceae bacterium]|nr:hypothetical protein [Leptotrichiaceae bacterium]